MSHDRKVYVIDNIVSKYTLIPFGFTMKNDSEVYLVTLTPVTTGMLSPQTPKPSK